MLHDIGMSVDYDDHHKHSRYLILNGGLPGFTPVEVAIIAQAARYHRKGMPEPGPDGARCSATGDAERLDRCAVLLRLAEDLERSRDQLVRDTSIALHDGEVELRLIADGESAVPRWAAGRESELFARAFHREPRRVAALTRASAVACWQRRALAPGAVEQHQPVGRERARQPGARCAATRQARCTAAVAPLPPRVEYSPPSTT